MEPITIAVAGCGSRGQDEYTRDLLNMGDRVRIVAAADIDEEKLCGMREKCGLPPEQCYPSAEAMLEQPRLADAMLICTPDACHYEEAKAALNKGYHLMLEKPIAPKAEQCRELSELALRLNRKVVVCHVLRYTPFYQQVKEVMDSGVLGEITSIQAIEQVCYWHQAHSFVRGNWRNEGLSSCMILQKCCHDMDILLWLTGKHCLRVSSFGSLMHFRPENAPQGATERCTDGCPAADQCPYNAVRFYMDKLRTGGNSWPVNVVAFDPTEEKVMEALRTGPYGRCVYHCDNDVVDHQVVTLQLEGGTTVDFTMCAFTAHGGRNIRVMGTKGELLGDLKTSTIRVMPFGGEETVYDVSALKDNLSAHAGGDARMVREFVDLVSGAPMSTTLTAIDRSVESHLVALAAEASRLDGGRVVSL